MFEMKNGLDSSGPEVSKGSYTQLSYLALHDLNNIKHISEKPRSNLGTPKRSVISLSELKLDELVSEKKWNDLDDFQLEELRDGFFDARYVRHEHRISENNLLETTNKKERSKSIDLDINLKNFFISLKSKVLADWKNLFKFFLAYLVSIILCVIHPTGKWIGHKYRYFMPISVLLHHPARNVGVQLEMTVFSCVGTAFGLGWSALAWYISTATGPTASHQGGILFQSLVMALCFAIWVRAYYQRFFYFCSSFGITIIFTHSVDLVFHASDLKWILFRDFALSYVFGLIISLLICIIIFPKNGNTNMIQTFDDTINTIKDFLIILVDKEKYNDVENISLLQSKMIKQLNINLSQTYHDFLNQFTILNYRLPRFKDLRDSLTATLSPLRVIPLHQKIFDNKLLEKLYEEIDKHKLREENKKWASNIEEIPSNYDSAIFSPVSSFSKSSSLFTSGISSEIYLSFLKKAFSRNILALILVMIIALDKSSQLLRLYISKSSEKELRIVKNELQELRKKLKKKIHNIDASYNKFLKSNIYSDEILNDFECIDIFLFVRYIRSSAKYLLKVLEASSELSTNSGWSLSTPNFKSNRTYHKLPSQCLTDQGLGKILDYFETKKDVDEIFERSYNSYTSRHTYSKMNEKFSSIRAIDHTDFNFHTTDNLTRFKLWEFSSLLSGREMKWTLKCLFCLIFLCLPSWLPESYHWYQDYECWWAPLIFFILGHKNKPAGKLITLINCLFCSLIGMFWGWAACQAYHFGNPYVICVFAGLISIPFAVNHLIYNNATPSYAALIAFTVISLEVYSKDTSSLSTAVIWKNCWTTSLSLIIGIIVSISINWIFWSYKSRTELRIAISHLLSHLSQSYQSVTERYLYRDLDDDPTELSLIFSQIREVRLTRNIEAIRELLTRAEREPIYISDFDAVKYYRLINTCQTLFERMIEARISGSYFEIWNQDTNNEVTRALLSLRRDGASSVIYIFYILSNCFRSKNKIPRYLPNSIIARKRLFDIMSKLEKPGLSSPPDAEIRTGSLEKQLFKRLGNNINQAKQDRVHSNSYSEASSNIAESDDEEVSRWKDIYGIAFARSFTQVCETIEVLTDCCKDILGEESF